MVGNKMTHSGTATVVSTKTGKGLSYRSGKGVYGGLTGELFEPFDCVLDVTPDGAPPFRAETTHKFSARAHPQEGDQVKVRCNPKKQTVEFDLSDDSRFSTSKEGRAARQAQNDERGAEVRQMIEAKRKAAREAGGFATDEERKQALIQQALQAGATPPAGAPVGSTSLDPMDEIAKAADLRDRGALTEAEFQAEKKRILGR